jgi:hypothetical protein
MHADASVKQQQLHSSHLTVLMVSGMHPPAKVVPRGLFPCRCCLQHFNLPSRQQHPKPWLVCGVLQAFITVLCVVTCLQDGSGLQPNEVPRVYFPSRPGNKVTLYHDAVCTPGPVPGITLASGGLYSESSCWDDIYVAIQKAERYADHYA